jgi:hypothetical protein
MFARTKEEPPCQLKRYLVGPSLSIESLNNLEGHYPEAFARIPEVVFLLIIDYIDNSNRRTLGQVCRPFLATIWLKGYLIRGSFTFRFPTEIRDSRKRDSYKLCMEFHKKRASYKDVCYFGGIMNQYPPQFCEENPPQWDVMTLESETNDYTINKLWANYLGKCKSLRFLRLDNVNKIHLNTIGELTKLEVLFMNLKSVYLLDVSIIPPSSVKAIAVSISEESDIQFSKRYINGSLYLKTLEGTQLDIW